LYTSHIPHETFSRAQRSESSMSSSSDEYDEKDTDINQYLSKEYVGVITRITKINEDRGQSHRSSPRFRFYIPAAANVEKIDGSKLSKKRRSGMFQPKDRGRSVCRRVSWPRGGSVTVLGCTSSVQYVHRNGSFSWRQGLDVVLSRLSRFNNLVSCCTEQQKKVTTAQKSHAIKAIISSRARSFFVMMMMMMNVRSTWWIRMRLMAGTMDQIDDVRLTRARSESAECSRRVRIMSNWIMIWLSSYKDDRFQELNSHKSLKTRYLVVVWVHWSDICLNFNYCCVLYMNIDEILNHAIKNVFYIQRTKCVHLSEK